MEATNMEVIGVGSNESKHQCPTVLQVDFNSIASLF